MKHTKIPALLLALVLIFSLLPQVAFAGADDDHTDQVRVIVENTTYSVEDGAPWDGTLVDTWVDLTGSSTVMSCVGAALDAASCSAEGLEDNYITSINGLAASDGGYESGWMGTLNDWFTNAGFGDFTEAAGTLAAGDEIRIMYTSNGYGEDLGGSWNNNLKTLSALTFSTGALNTAFDSDTHAYTLTVPAGTTSVQVTPTAANKNFQVHTSVDDAEYKRTASIPVTNGTLITVTCGDPAWPTMNGGDYGTADSVPAETYTVTVAMTPEAATLSSLLVHTSTSPSASNVLLKNAGDAYDTALVFDPAVTDYTLATQLDTLTQLRFRPLAADAGATTTLTYAAGSKNITWTSGSSTWANCLQAGRNVLTLTVTPAATSAKTPQTYTLTVDCLPTLSALSATFDASPLYLDKTFAAATADYTLTLPDSATAITLNAVPKSADYTVTYNGSADPTVNVAGKNKIEVVLTAGSGDAAVQNTYTILLQRESARTLAVNVTPADAVTSVYDQNGAAVSPNADGTFTGLFAAATYTYTVSKYGYLTQSGNVPATGGTLNITLEKAATGLPAVDSAWKNFRNSDVNMAITDASTPIVKGDTSLLWSAKLGSGWSAAPSVQIIVDNALIVMSGATLYKLDLATGETIATGTMTAAPNYGYTPPTYAEGMIFCPLTNGTIQAFDAKTLESLWIYKDALKGQSLSPITYHDGYLYTGFWNGETKDAAFVCLSVTDESPDSADEAKTAVWRHAQPGGFYWAGSVVIGDSILTGTDDGTSGTAGNSHIYAYNRLTGKLLSSVELTGMGDQRSSLSYDSASSRIYFTTKGGYLCSLGVDAQTGALSDLKSVNYHAQSTSTPVVYNGRVYFGTGSGISSTGSSGNFVCADAATLEMVFAIGLKGYPQCSVLLSTAYEATGNLYFYSTYNAQPGGISMIKVPLNAASADDAELTELYDADGFSQYCITSLICGSDGTLYYKNDSGNVFAVGVPKATQVFNLIAAIGDVSAMSGPAIRTARSAYNALSEADQAKVTNYALLPAAEAAFDAACAAQVSNLIAAIGTVTLSGKDAIIAARSAYNALTAAQQAQVGILSVLLAAEEKLLSLEQAAAAKPDVPAETPKDNAATSTPAAPLVTPVETPTGKPAETTPNAEQDKTPSSEPLDVLTNDTVPENGPASSLTWLWVSLIALAVLGLGALLVWHKKQSR